MGPQRLDLPDSELLSLSLMVDEAGDGKAAVEGRGWRRW